MSKRSAIAWISRRKSAAANRPSPSAFGGVFEVAAVGVDEVGLQAGEGIAGDGQCLIAADGRGHIEGGAVVEFAAAAAGVVVAAGGMAGDAA